MICILVFGASFSYAAENALPGDALYPVKIHINENIRTALAVTPQAKAGWEIRQAERRLEEAEKLASEGRLSAQASAEISTSFQSRASQIHNNIEQFKSKGQINDAAEISSNLEASLSAHKKILSELNDEENKNDPGETKETKNIIDNIDVKAEETHEIRASAEEKINAQIQNHFKVSAQNRRKAAQNKIQEVRNFLSKWKNKLGAKVVLDAEIKLQEGEKAIVEGDAKVQAQRSGEAFALYQKAHRIAQEAKLLLEARRSLNIDVWVNKKENGGKEGKDDQGNTQGDEALQENDKQDNSQRQEDKKNENNNDNKVEDIKNIEGNINASLKAQIEMRKKSQEEARKRLEDMKKNVNKEEEKLEVKDKND